jgi:hypothetical protein
MTTTLPPDEERFEKIFFPYSYQQRLQLHAEGTRVVHYTNADAAMNILRTKTIWMRNASCMNDFSEVHYGLARLWSTYRADSGKRFRVALNEIFSGFSDEIEKRFNAWTPMFQQDTYMACLSEHRNDEDQHGRLSMWRAYGKGTGVALIIKNHVLLNPAPGLGAYASPVAYLW